MSRLAAEYFTPGINQLLTMLGEFLVRSGNQVRKLMGERP